MSDFWCWVLIIIVIAAIFGAGKLPDLKKEMEEKVKLGMAALEKGKEELNKKLAEKAKTDKITAKKEKKAEENKDKADLDNNKE